MRTEQRYDPNNSESNNNSASGNSTAQTAKRGRVSENPLYGLRVFNYEVEMESRLPGNSFSVSECEMILEALSYHKIRLYDDLRYLMGTDPKQTENRKKESRDTIKDSLESGELPALVQQLVQVADLMSILGNVAAGRLQEMYAANPLPTNK